MIEVKPPYGEVKWYREPTLFLAGSIEQGTAEPWQQYIVTALSKQDIVIFNPRRDKWDASLEQTLENKQFKDQIIWEQEALSQSDIVVFYFQPGTKCPITLLEFGYTLGYNAAEDYYQNQKDLVVCCPSGFWRKGNVDVMCERFEIKQVPDLDGIVRVLKRDWLGINIE